MAALTYPHGGNTSYDRSGWLRLPLGLGMVAAGLSLIVWEGRFRVQEAKISAWLMRSLGIRRPAISFGSAVVFPLHDRWVGFTVTLACTAALLVVPFFLLGGALILTGRVSRVRALLALAITTVLVFAVNQLRLLVITGSMVHWGFQKGYDRSHIFLGTVVSTVGVVAGVVIFVWMLVMAPERKRARMTGS